MATLASVIDDYLDDCRARGLSLKTVEDNYGYALRERFLPWCSENGVDALEGVDTKLMTRWQADLLTKPGRRGKPISRFSSDGWIKAVNKFLKWAHEQGEIEQLAHGPGIKKPKPKLDPPSRQEIDRMESRAQTERDKLIVRLLADTGIRASELLALRPSDLIERDRQYHLRIAHGKGDKERWVPVPRLAPRIRRFLVDGDGGQIFTGLRKRAGENRPLTLSGLQKMIRSLAREAGVSKKVHPHAFRHAYTSWALAGGMSAIQVANILGHDGLHMIQRHYSHLSSRDAYEAQQRLYASS
jgi:integrase/recombinase XerD